MFLENLQALIRWAIRHNLKYNYSDSGDDSHRPTAGQAGIDVNREHPLQALRPGHVHPVFGGRSITVRGVSVSHTVSGMVVFTLHSCRSDILIESLQRVVSRP